jgi:hypothetical protein
MMDELARRLEDAERIYAESERANLAYGQVSRELRNFGMGTWLLFDTGDGTVRRGLVVGAEWSTTYNSPHGGHMFQFEVRTDDHRHHAHIRPDQVVEVLAPSAIRVEGGA